MILPQVSDDEYLYRAIHHTQWKDDEKRPRTSAFRNGDEESVSVDRQANRTHEEAHRAFHERPIHQGKRTAGLEAETFRILTFQPRYSPIPDEPEGSGNPFHCDLLNKVGTFRITKAEAFLICDAIKNHGVVIDPLG